MAGNIKVERYEALPMEERKTEIVARKGLGHPDSVADGLAESVSRALCKMYLDRYGWIFHHNTDETQIVGGQSIPRFGGGEVIEPVYILLVGRAVTEVEGERLPYRTTAVRAAREYLRNNFPNLDINMDVMIDCRIGKGSADLRAVYDTKRYLANDTSFGVGFAPFSEAERLTYEIERYINGPLKNELKELGEDVKVMTCRHGDEINVTVAVAFVSKYVDDRDHYLSVLSELREKLLDYSSKFTNRQVNLHINTADDYKKGIYYLTVTGLSMENGDDGSVGRGNRVYGLITPYRPMSMEAAAGKNPVTHVGKLYNILSLQIARKIVEEGGGDVLEAYVWLLSQIGRPITEPFMANVKLMMAPNASFSKAAKMARDVAEEQISNIGQLTMDIVEGRIQVF
ncbi:MAG: methionine adenosyltransferase [Thermoplasmata archaeon]|nr:MAG: methionine adenosyltransferase [Thermoplasmata archaeon]